MALGMTSAAVFASSDVRVVVDGYEVQFVDQGPILVDGRVLAPVRGVFDQMGFDISWDGRARVATLTSDDVTIVIPADGVHFYVNDELVTPVVPQRLLNGRLLLPLAAIADAVGATATWDSVTRVATITTAAVEEAPADDEVDYDDEYAYEEDYDAEDDDYVYEEDYDADNEDDYDAEDEDDNDEEDDEDDNEEDDDDNDDDDEDDDE